MVFGPIVIVPNLPAILSDATLPKPLPNGTAVWIVGQRLIQSYQRHIRQRSLSNKRENGDDGEELEAPHTFVL